MGAFEDAIAAANAEADRWGLAHYHTGLTGGPTVDDVDAYRRWCKAYGAMVSGGFGMSNVDAAKMAGIMLGATGVSYTPPMSDWEVVKSDVEASWMSIKATIAIASDLQSQNYSKALADLQQAKQDAQDFNTKYWGAPLSAPDFYAQSQKYRDSIGREDYRTAYLVLSGRELPVATGNRVGIGGVGGLVGGQAAGGSAGASGGGSGVIAVIAIAGAAAFLFLRRR